jgi:hypothetical protein
MNRRRFIRVTLDAGLFLGSNLPATDTSVQVRVDTQPAFGRIPANFIGLGYEISSVARAGLLSANNRQYVRLVRTLGPRGVIRVGGNTSDYAHFSRAGGAVSEPKATVINETNLRELGSFLDATGWELIWGLNLGRGSEREAIEEARAVVENVKGKLYAFEVGNEPDLFRKVHREPGYGYEDFSRDYRRFAAAIRKSLPKVAFAGPDAASATDWVTRFAADEGRDLKLLTHHYYRECNNPGSTCEKLLRDDPKLAPELEKLKSASAASHLPYRICETNSFCGGGKPGVSDTFCEALWALDFMFKLASAEAAGVNMETGVNQLGFISSYSPIRDDEHGTYSAAPGYYGMLAFAQASQGRRLSVSCNAGDLNLTAYAVADERQRVVVTLINKDTSDATVNVTGPTAQRASLVRLSGPGLGSKEGVTLGGSNVKADGTWKPTHQEVPIKQGLCRVNVPAASAAIVTFAALRN